MENLIPVLRSHRTPRGDIDTARETVVFNFVSKCDFHPLSYAFELRCVQGEQQKKHLNRAVFVFCSSVGLKVKGTSLSKNGLF